MIGIKLYNSRCLASSINSSIGSKAGSSTRNSKSPSSDYRMQAKPHSSRPSPMAPSTRTPSPPSASTTTKSKKVFPSPLRQNLHEALGSGRPGQVQRLLVKILQRFRRHHFRSRLLRPKYHPNKAANIDMSRAQMHELLGNKSLAGLPLLLLGNKNDL